MYVVDYQGEWRKGFSRSHFTNTGDEPLTIIIPSPTADADAPNLIFRKSDSSRKKCKIKITFQPKGRSGEFNRSVKVKTNAESGRRTLTFNGVD